MYGKPYLMHAFVSSRSAMVQKRALLSAMVWKVKAKTNETRGETRWFIRRYDKWFRNGVMLVVEM